MKRSEAALVLRISELASKEQVQDAYIQRIREIEDTNSSEGQLTTKSLNIARDILLETNEQVLDVTSAMFRETAAMNMELRSIDSKAEAREELSASIAVTVRSRQNRIKRKRNWSAIFSGLSAACLVFKNQLSETFPLIFPSLGSEESVVAGATLALISVVFGCLAYSSNQNAAEISELAENLKRVIGRKRNIRKILASAFPNDEAVDDYELDWSLRYSLSDLTGAEFEDPTSSTFKQVLADVGLDRISNLKLGNDFIDEYIEFLEASGYIEARKDVKGELVYIRT